MSKVGQWRQRLQELPAYEEGWYAGSSISNPYQIGSEDYHAWQCGKQDAWWDSQPDGGPDETEYEADSPDSSDSD